MAVIVENNEIWLTGTVGAYWWDDGFSSTDVAFALARIGRSADVVVHLNSGGGIASEGAAIHAQLAAHKGKVEIFVEGTAASAASAIAMAGDRVVMAIGATMMIHDPMVQTIGNIAEHLKSVDYLKALAASYAELYAEKTGRPAEEMRGLMAAETWMTAEEAVAAGFADATTAASARAANDNQPTAFAYRAYAHAPAALTALADACGWALPLPHLAVAPTARANTPPPAPVGTASEDTTMPDTPVIPDPTVVAEATSAAKARIKAITTAEAASGREALAAHFAFETDMTAEAAVTALAAAPKAAVATDPAAGYAARRAAAASLAQPGGGGGNQPSALSAAVASTNKRR